MTNKVSIVYVGVKPEKKDTVAGTGLVFPRMAPVSVDSAIAHQLLRFKSVWLKEDEVKSHVKALEDKEREAKQAEQEKAEQEAIEAEEASLLVDGFGDLGKMTSVQLATLAESESLAIDKKGAREKLADYAVRVRDALKAKA